MEKIPKKNENIDSSRRKFLKKAGVLVGGLLLSDALSIFTNSSNEKKEKENLNNIEYLKEIIKSKDAEKFLESPYIISALYYSDEYIDEVVNKKNKTPQEKIISGVSEFVTIDTRARYIEMLNRKLSSSINNLSKKETLPLKNFETGFNTKENHRYAIDIFAKEGSDISTITSGVIVLAEDGWIKNEDLSTSSRKGGNTVIIFNAFKKEFYRYAHLDKVYVKPGDIINSGNIIGTVGHSGENASKLGHGEHLHLEVNVYNDKNDKVKALNVNELKEKLTSIKNNY